MFATSDFKTLNKKLFDVWVVWGPVSTIMQNRPLYDPDSNSV